ncbi:MAG: acetyltransferase [Ferrovibrio sp.]|uniref:acetyltransferase n=1 Tax=Ferrovibrio sp. TaxID=1917215 RepID=UPI002634A624|nr:acetyltransferase [Ferrovibrio sp.]MCW0235402.1 acetyltransferase [Ferrovibrio sp.]
MPKRIFGLYGAGGFAREVMPFVRDSLRRAFGEGDLPTICFLETRPDAATVNGIPVLSEDAFFALDCEERYFNVAIGSPKDRQRLAETCLQRGARPLTLQAGNTTIYEANEIAAGAILCANSMVTSNARIGKYFHSNIYSYVAHDCVIGDYVTFAPRVNCNGKIHIGDYAYIGTGAVIREGASGKPLVIGEGAVVGMGAVVTRDVAPYTTVVGNPARPLAS